MMISVLDNYEYRYYEYSDAGLCANISFQMNKINTYAICQLLITIIKTRDMLSVKKKGLHTVLEHACLFGF